MSHSKPTTVQRPMRRDQQPRAHTDDSYVTLRRLKTAARCTTCGATYDDGRWTWREAPDDAKAEQCPACKRTHDQAPAGELVLSGAYLHGRRADILALLNHQAEDETSEHPLERIMEIADGGDAEMTVRTTGVHLLRRLGKAMLRAHHGELVLSGAYLHGRRADILALLNHQAEDETSEHPLERIMEIADGGDAEMTVRTTGVHLLRRLGKAMLRAHHGELKLHNLHGEGILRAEWKRADA